MTESLSFTRRSMLTLINVSAGGLVLGLYPSLGIAAPGDKASKGLTPNVFLHLARDGQLTVVCHRSEMGQGIRSSLPVLLADELGADLSRMVVEQADGDAKYGDQNTDGSSSSSTRSDHAYSIAVSVRTVVPSGSFSTWMALPIVPEPSRPRRAVSVSRTRSA